MVVAAAGDIQSAGDLIDAAGNIYSRLFEFNTYQILFGDSNHSA